MRRARRERGTVTVIAALAYVALVLFGALAIDIGIAWSARRQSQVAASAAALAAAATMIDQSGSSPSVDTAGATSEATAYAQKHSTIGNAQLSLGDGDVEFGNWCPAQPGFDLIEDASALADPNQVTAVRVHVRLNGDAGDANRNRRSPAFLARLGGYEVNSSAVAYLGFAGSAPPADLDLPLAISGCALDPSNDCCGTPDFCEGGPTPSPCPGDPTKSCLAPSLLNPIACWSGLNLDSFGTQDLLDLIAGGGNPEEIRVGDAISLGEAGILHVDVLGALEAQLSAAPGGFLVVKLPVVQCDGLGGGLLCSGDLPYAGSVCFKIELVIPEVTPGLPEVIPGLLGFLEQAIVGEFLCPDDPEFASCRDAGAPAGPPREAGGCNYGLRADRAVLVQ